MQVLLARIAAIVSIPETAITLTLVAISLYIPVYLFVGMRKVYGQGRLVTFLKYIVLTVTYITGIFITMLVTLGIAAFAI